MRIILDMEAAQAANRNRGIGGYVISLAKALLVENKKHDIFLVFSAQFEDTLFELYEIFTPLIPSENIKIWHGVRGTAFLPDEAPKKIISTQLKKLFFEALDPDMIMVMSFFEGFVDDAIIPAPIFKENIQVVCIVYDLIPLLYPHLYLQNPNMKQWYLEKIEQLSKFDKLLAISASTRNEIIETLSINHEKVVNISTGREERFHHTVIDELTKKQLFKKYNIFKPYLIYTGGMDPRKNISRLIEAFASLSKKVLNEHQLVIVCQITDEQRTTLTAEINKYKTLSNSVVLTGYVDEDELLALYNLAKAAIFPSLHEGFGLPILEAMQCGKAVIGSNVSSIPEVIGLQDALFDPTDKLSIAQKITQVLTDKMFLLHLQEHSQSQILRFSWQKSASTAIKTLEELYSDKNVVSPPLTARKRLAYLSPLPPQRSGISNYSAELLPYLHQYYSIDIITNEDKIEDDWILSNCSIYSIEWFESNHLQYERIMYHFGNSHFHAHMFELLQKIPGTVVLHDFFLSGIIGYIDTLTQEDFYFEKTLFYSHGYKALQEAFSGSSRSDIIWKYPLNLSVLQNALGVIMHSEFGRHLAGKWYGETSQATIKTIPLLREGCSSKMNTDKLKLKFSKDAFLVCSFGLLGPTKLNHRLIEAYLASSLAKQKKCYLIFVGENHIGNYGMELINQIEESPCKESILITGWTDMDTFNDYLSVADIGVQLRTNSRGETSAAVLDCMNYGLATIVNANGSMADIPSNSIYKLADEFTTEELTEALEKLYTNKLLRDELALNAKNTIQTLHNPQTCANQYFDAIEHFYTASQLSCMNNIEKKLDMQLLKEDETLMLQVASSLAKIQKQTPRHTQLLVDVSELRQRDAHTGIQRVVKNIINQLFQIVPSTIRIELVYATPTSEGYIYAREFTSTLLNIPHGVVEDEPVDYEQGDIFLGLDLQPHIVVSQQKAFHSMKAHGVNIYFVIYDLLCVNMPQHFSAGADESFEKWLHVVSQANGAVAISKSVMQEFKDWRTKNTKYKNNNFKYDWFYLGVDHDEYSKEVLNTEVLPYIMTQGRPNFLMVGTLEPRKGHRQVLQAFEELWLEHSEVNLIIVGKQGWMVDELVKAIQNHFQLNQKLLWIDSCSDNLLDLIYQHTICLIAASEGEGFGLPLIEAAHKKIPILARDIPVFREISNENVTFFQNNLSENTIKEAIKKWLQNSDKNNNFLLNDFSSWSWRQSATKLLNSINIAI